MPLVLDRTLMVREGLSYVPALESYVRTGRMGHWMNFMLENGDG